MTADLISALRNLGAYNPHPRPVLTADQQRLLDQAEDIAADLAEQRQWSSDADGDRAAGVVENRATVAAESALEWTERGR